MSYVRITIAFLVVLWSAFGFARENSVPGEETVSTQTPSSTVEKSAEASENRQIMTDIHDIKPLVSVPVPVSWAAVALWSAACVAVAGVLLGVWLLWRRRRRLSVKTVEAVLSPEETAFQRLARLSEDTGIGGKIYYFQLSFIFREYLQGRFGIDGLEMTTEELLPHLEMMRLDRDLRREAKSFIVSSDPVKYADAPALRESMAADFAFVKFFVEKTMASAEEPAAATDGTTTGVAE